MRARSGFFTMTLLLALYGPLPAGPLRVGVSVLPLESIVAEIGGDAVEVKSLQQEGDSCSVFEPRPSTISWLATASLFFRTGAGYEPSILEKVRSQFTNLEVLDLRDVVEVLPYADHEHEQEGGPVEETDPHIWLDPVRLAVMGDWIADQLARARPEEAKGFLQRGERFHQEAMAIHKELEQMLAPYRGRSFYIYHPALNYFAKRYGLHQVSLSSPASPPGARELHRLVSEAKASGVKTIFVQPQESRRHAEVVARAVGAKVVEIDPMNRDWRNNLLRIGRSLAESFRAQ